MCLWASGAADILWSVSRPLYSLLLTGWGQCTVICGWVFVFVCVCRALYGAKWLTVGKRRDVKWPQKMGQNWQETTNWRPERKQRNLDQEATKEIKSDGLERLKVLNWLTPFGVGTIFVGINRRRSWIWIWFSVLWSLKLGAGGLLEMTNESVCIVLSAVGVGVRGWRRRRGGHLQVRTRRRRGKEKWWTFTSEDKQPLQQRGQTPFPIGALQWLLHQWYLSQLFKGTLTSTPYHIDLFIWSSIKIFRGGVTLQV